MTHTTKKLPGERPQSPIEWVQRRITELQAELDRVTALLHHKEELERKIALYREMLDDLTAPPEQHQHQIPPLRGLSIPNACATILRTVGKPLSSKELYHYLLLGGKQLNAKAPIMSIVSALRRDKLSRFIRYRPKNSMYKVWKLRTPSIKA